MLVHLALCVQCIKDWLVLGQEGLGKALTGKIASAPKLTMLLEVPNHKQRPEIQRDRPTGVNQHQLVLNCCRLSNAASTARTAPHPKLPQLVQLLLRGGVIPPARISLEGINSHRALGPKLLELPPLALEGLKGSHDQP